MNEPAGLGDSSIQRHPDAPLRFSFGTPVDRRWSCVLGIIAFTLTLASFLQAASQRGVLHAPPTADGDEADYERLGYHLAAGYGFGHIPEELHSQKTAEQFIPTAYRPPGFPFLIAAVYQIRPSDYFLIRLINCVACSVASGLVAAYFAREVSAAASLGVGLLGSLDPRLREFAGTFLTENLATLLFCLFAISFTRLMMNGTRWNAAICGLSLSALVCVRSFYVAWYPVIWIVIAFVLLVPWRICLWTDRRILGRSQGFMAFLIFAFTSVLLTGPWWIRNCLVLEAVMPTGTQGGIGIADGFSESAWKNHGSWTSETAGRIAETMRQDPACRNLKQLEFEREHSRRGSASAREWIRENLSRVPQLTFWKFCRLWEIGESRSQMVLFSAMIAGLLIARRNPLAQTLVLLLLLNTLTVMATYHTYERFMTPFRPLIHGFAVVAVLALIPGRRRPSEPAEANSRTASS
jgi:hypothetical protein